MPQLHAASTSPLRMPTQNRSGRSLLILWLQLGCRPGVFETLWIYESIHVQVLEFFWCIKHSSKHHIVRSSHNILLRCLGSILVLLDAALDLFQALTHLQQWLIRGLSSCWWLLFWNVDFWNSIPTQSHNSNFADGLWFWCFFGAESDLSNLDLGHLMGRPFGMVLDVCQKNKLNIENHCGSDVVPPPPRLHFQAFHGAL